MMLSTPVKRRLIIHLSFCTLTCLSLWSFGPLCPPNAWINLQLATERFIAISHLLLAHGRMF